jgi:hypothetical protein
MIVIPHPAPLKIGELNGASNDIFQNIWQQSFGAVKGGHNIGLYIDK